MFAQGTFFEATFSKNYDMDFFDIFKIIFVELKDFLGKAIKRKKEISF